MLSTDNYRQYVSLRTEQYFWKSLYRDMYILRIVKLYNAHIINISE